MFGSLRHNMALRRFKREFRNYKRTGKVFNLDEARSVGIIYKADSEETFSIVKKYIRQLKEEEGIKKIMALGLYDDRKEKTQPEFLVPKLEYDFITRRQHVKNERPGGVSVKNFCEEEFDILIDLTFEKEIPLLYILNQSRARFKVGYHVEEVIPFYDLLVMHNENKSITDLIDSVNHILKKINKVYEA